ncbi:MAG: LEA type 2 family protein [Bacteroidota bacterium]|jgi:LEA14-like dessication related protein
MSRFIFRGVMCWCILCFSGCSLYDDVKVGKLDSVDINSIQGNHVNATLNFQIENPNPYAITLFESDVLLKIDGIPAGTIVLLEPVKLAKNSKSTVPIQVTTETNELESILGNAMALMFKPEIRIEAGGYVKAKGLGLVKNVPVQFEKRITKNQLGQ